MFPIILNDENAKLPEEGRYFVIASNGIFFHKELIAEVGCRKQKIASGFVKVNNIGFLEEFKGDNIQYFLPKIPGRIIYDIQRFFSLVVEKYKSEAGSILYYDIVKSEWHVVIPEQKVSHGGVVYRLGPNTTGWIRVGTIHSHCDFNAFHSGVDVDDEKDFDGIHATFGNNDQKHFSITVSVVLNGVRKQIDPLTVMEDISLIKGEIYLIKKFEDNKEIEENWLKRVSALR